MTLKNVTMGISVCRNVKLANVFYRLELIEAYGTGILKIMDSYEGTRLMPKIETSDNAFKIILPNQPERKDRTERTGQYGFHRHRGRRKSDRAGKGAGSCHKKGG